MRMPPEIIGIIVEIHPVPALQLSRIVPARHPEISLDRAAIGSHLDAVAEHAVEHVTPDAGDERPVVHDIRGTQAFDENRTIRSIEEDIDRLRWADPRVGAVVHPLALSGFVRIRDGGLPVRYRHPILFVPGMVWVIETSLSATAIV